MPPNTLRQGTPVRADGALRPGLTAGALEVDPFAHGARRGRRRRWCYAAAGGGQVAIGAAVVDLGPAGTVFVWASVEGHTVAWSRKVLLGRGTNLAPTPQDGASYRGGGARVAITPSGGIEVDVPLPGGARLVADIAAPTNAAVTPAVLATATPRGGWNVTQKAAGYGVSGRITLDGRNHLLEGHGWRDWTAGRQDRRTRWRWAAGGGRATDGTRVGFNVSTGMNAAGAGEDVVWWDGRPHRLEVTTLGPVGDELAGPWVVQGPGWSLQLSPWGVRAADENVVLLRSRYVQPIGRLRGTLPGPDGGPVEIEAVGVTEDHQATW